MNLVKKTIGIYKNQGSATLLKKGRNFTKYHLGRFYMNRWVRNTSKALRDEYDYISNPIFQITAGDIKKSNEAISAKLPKKIKTANWFVPNFDHIKFGGIYTIFRFIEKLNTEGVENRIIIYDNPSFNKDYLVKQISENFKNLTNYKIIIYDMNNDGINSLPESDLAFCSFWTSAYILLRFNKTKRKYYFLQDYEPLFYPGGSTYALAESTYRFGFRGLVNTPGLLAAVNKRHGMKGISFVPSVDQSIYHPYQHAIKRRRVRIFFYTRPNNPRNAFNLCILIIKNLIVKYGGKIEIVTAGANWNEKEYGLKGLINNLGLLGSLDEVAEVYRKCDIGVCYMLSKHPSYQPFEFMASGMATVTNNNEDNLWLLRDGKNCLLGEPSPADMADKIGQLIEDKQLREKIAKNGLESLGYTWTQQTDMIWNDIKTV